MMKAFWLERAYEESEPDALLADFVKRFWRFSNPTATAKHYTILPDGYFDLILSIRDNALVSVSLFGLCTQELAVSVPAHTTVLGVCFKPLAADCILNQSIAPILNGTKLLPDDFWGIDALPFDHFGNWTAQMTHKAVVELRSNALIDSRKQAIFRLLFNASGALTVQAISR